MTLFTVEGLIRAIVRGSERGGIVDPRAAVHHAYLRWLATQGLRSAILEDEPDGWLVGERRLHELDPYPRRKVSAAPASTG